MPLLISRIAALGRRRVLVFDDGGDRPRSSRTIRPYPWDRRTTAVRTVAAAPCARWCVDQRLQCGRPQQRNVARQQHHRARLARQGRFRLQQCVAGAELRLLHCKAQAQPCRECAAGRRRPGGRRSRRSCAGLRASAARKTCSISGSPAARCSTFGSADFMRVPLPAARMTTWMSDMACPEQFSAAGRGGRPRCAQRRRRAAGVCGAGLRGLRAAIAEVRRQLPRCCRDPGPGAPVTGSRGSARSRGAGGRSPPRCARAAQGRRHDVVRVIVVRVGGQGALEVCRAPGVVPGVQRDRRGVDPLPAVSGRRAWLAVSRSQTRKYSRARSSSSRSSGYRSMTVRNSSAAAGEIVTLQRLHAALVHRDRLVEARLSRGGGGVAAGAAACAPAGAATANGLTEASRRAGGSAPRAFAPARLISDGGAGCRPFGAVLPSGATGVEAARRCFANPARLLRT